MKNQLKEFRKSRHITQSEIANICGVAQNTVSNWESGRQDISMDNVNKIANYYNVEPQRIVIYDEIDNNLNIMKNLNDLGMLGLNLTKEQFNNELNDIEDNPIKMDALSKVLDKTQKMLPIMQQMALFDDEPFNNILDVINILSYQDKETIKKIKSIIEIIVKK